MKTPLHRIEIKVSGDVMAAMTQRAEEMGVPLSTWLRIVAIKESKKEATT